MADMTPLGRRLSWAAASLVVLIAACSDDPTLPLTPDPPADAIQDAANGENGNPFVFLKPPVVEAPSSSDFGTFNPNVEPIVEVCELGAGDVCTILTTNDGTDTEARYTVDGGPGGESVTVDLTAEEYQVQIHFSLFDLADNTTYRIVTRVGDMTLAFADVVVVSPREMKSADSDNNIVFTNSMKTVPWKVRIDEGALCWEPGETVVSCTSSTVTVGEEETVTLIASDGEEVELELPAGWTATVDGEAVSDLTISIEEVPADNTVEGDPTCFFNFVLGDPTIGEPDTCYEVRADTDTQTDVTVEFGTERPILAFCPDADVLQQIANGAHSFIMTSVEDDVQGAVRRTYPNAEPVGGLDCSLGTASLFGDSPVGRFAARVWEGVRPLMNPIIPAPLHAVDLGFGGELSRLGTIFFWASTPTAVTVAPASTSVNVGQTVQLSVEPTFHEGETVGGVTVDIQWASNDPTVATVDATGLVTGISSGTTQIVVTATDVLDPLGNFLIDSASVTVNANTAVISGVVTDGTQPLAGIQIHVQGTSIGTITNAAGEYVLAAVPAGPITLAASSVGYFTQTQNINAVGGQSHIVDFQLVPSGNLTVDQSNTTTDGTTFSNPGGSLWQTFTPTGSPLVAVDLGFRVGGNFPPSGHTSTVSIRSGSPTGPILGTASAFIASAQASTSIDVTHTLASPIALDPGSTYVIEWLSADPSTVSWFGGPGNPYPGGEALGGSGTPLAGDVDFVFSTYVIPQAAATLLEPTSGAVIQQNDPTIGCTLLLQNGRGFGYEVFFDWTDVGGADSYEITAGFPNATLPLVDATVTQSELLFTSCNSFTHNLDAVEWQVRPVTNGVPGPLSAVETFDFGPCLLEDGSPCVSATAPIGFEVLPDGSSPTSGMSVSTQFAGLGAVFAFTPASGGAGTARICDSTSFSQLGAPSDHSVTFDDQTGSGANACSPATLGTITTTITATTSAVEFRLTYPDLATPNVSAESKTGAPVAAQIMSLVAYTSQGGLLMREALYRVPGNVGSIDVSQTAGGGIMLIDELHLQQ